jgi:peroxiredoxin-like protein
MTPLPHHYDVALAGGPAGYATLSADGLPELSMAAPRDYDGPGDAWSPEHLLVAAVQACFLLTFRAVARAAQLPFVRLDATATGTVDRAGGVTRFTGIVIRPRLVVPPGTDRQRAVLALEKAETRCLVSASLNTSIRIEAEVSEG